VAPYVKHLFNGRDIVIYAHGSSGSGKTYTLRGRKSLSDRGIIPRLLSAVYRRARKVEKVSGGQVEVRVALSYYEMHDGKAFDLLDPVPERTRMGVSVPDIWDHKIMEGMTERICATLKESEILFDQANMRRSTSASRVRLTLNCEIIAVC
jgi:protein transport protein SEC24